MGEIKLKNLVSKIENGVLKIQDEDVDFFLLPFHNTSDDLPTESEYTAIIKSIERICRTCGDYKYYISQLKEVRKLNRCSVFGHITDDVAKIEMHHGPVYSLYDCAEIIYNHKLKEDGITNIFDIAELLIDEHFNDNIQIIPLCKSVHKSVHNKSKTNKKPYFLSYESAVGRLDNFIRKYYNGFSSTHINKLKHYIELCEQNIKDEVFNETFTNYKKQFHEFGGSN